MEKASMTPKRWVAKGAVATGPPEAVVRLTQVVEKYKVWLWSDDEGSWVALHESPAPLRARPIDLWGVYWTREDALRAVWEAGQVLRSANCDRRKMDRRQHGRGKSDRRASVDAEVWTTFS
jgi:hypothetical protein